MLSDARRSSSDSTFGLTSNARSRKPRRRPRSPLSARECRRRSISWSRPGAVAVHHHQAVVDHPSMAQLTTRAHRSVPLRLAAHQLVLVLVEAVDAPPRMPRRRWKAVMYSATFGWCRGCPRVPIVERAPDPRNNDLDVLPRSSDGSCPCSSLGSSLPSMLRAALAGAGCSLAAGVTAVKAQLAGTTTRAARRAGGLRRVGRGRAFWRTGGPRAHARAPDGRGAAAASPSLGRGDGPG
jgi:hypothetical protein